jgi:hypothetical protein
VLAAAAVLLLAAAGAHAGSGFRNSSLFGTFASIGAGDGHTSASLGTTTYDGQGGVTRSLVVNAPDGNGGRRLLTFEGTGVYEVHPDGTGVLSLTNVVNGTTTLEVTIDFVIQDSMAQGKGGQRRATKLYGIQREAGTTVSLVTNSETLIAP